MTDEELAYLRGQSDAYNNVFKAFATAFEDGQDIHGLRQRVSAQWDELRATQIVRVFL